MSGNAVFLPLSETSSQRTLAGGSYHLLGLRNRLDLGWSFSSWTPAWRNALPRRSLRAEPGFFRNLASAKTVEPVAD